MPASNSIPAIDSSPLQFVPFAVIHIVLMALGSLLIFVGLVGYVVAVVVEKVLKPKLTAHYRRLHDDGINYPFCAIAATQQSIRIATPWKEYFTREEQPFVNDNPVP